MDHWGDIKVNSLAHIFCSLLQITVLYKQIKELYTAQNIWYYNKLNTKMLIINTLTHTLSTHYQGNNGTKSTAKHTDLQLFTNGQPNFKFYNMKSSLLQNNEHNTLCIFCCSVEQPCAGSFCKY